VYVAQEKLDLAEKEFRKALTIDPANHDGHYNLGVVLMAKGSPAESIPHFLQVRPLNMATRFNLVRAYLLSGKTKEGTCRRRSNFHPRQEMTFSCTSRSECYSPRQSNYNSAEHELEKANALQPETFEILYNLGQAYVRSGKYDKAEIVLNRDSS